MYSLPTLTSNLMLENGSLIKLLPFCLNHCKKEKCQNYYNQLKDASYGIYECPYGLSSFVYKDTNINIIFTGIKIYNYYNKGKISHLITEEKIFNPVLKEQQCEEIAKEISNYVTLNKRIEEMNALLHETRALNGQSKTIIDHLFDSNSTNEGNFDSERTLEVLKNAQIINYLISNRFSYFDSVVNPSLSSGEPYEANIFKKFDKMRKLLKGYLNNNVAIVLYSPQHCEYKYKIYPVFETLLFIIIENAIKYSQNNSEVQINFNENANILDVSIESIGPYCNENELLHLCDKGFRGENARIFTNVGQGFGLNFAKIIAQKHNIGIKFDSVYNNKEYGIKYGKFIVTLHFDNKNYYK